jgi:regulatory protein
MPSAEIKELLGKAQHFCSYQERCTKEVQRRLVILGATEDQREEVIRILTSEGFLDDLRFAREYAHGKFRNNQWGKVRIRLELNSRGIAFGHIQEALDTIDEAEYLETIRKLAEKKYESLGLKKSSHIKEKVASFCSQKGFESDLVWQAVKEISNKK